MEHPHSVPLLAAAGVVVASGAALVAVGATEVAGQQHVNVWANGWFAVGMGLVAVGVALTLVALALHFKAHRTPLPAATDVPKAIPADSPPRRYVKGPGDTKDFKFDWTSWLGDDTIRESTWTVPEGLTKGADTFTTHTATVWLSGGADGSSYRVTNRITTAGGRVSEESVRIAVETQSV